MKTIEQRAEEWYSHTQWYYSNVSGEHALKDGYFKGAIDQQELMMAAFKTFLATFNGAAPASYVQREFEKGMENRLKYQQEEPEL